MGTRPNQQARRVGREPREVSGVRWSMVAMFTGRKAIGFLLFIFSWAAEDDRGRKRGGEMVALQLRRAGQGAHGHLDIRRIYERCSNVEMVNMGTMTKAVGVGVEWEWAWAWDMLHGSCAVCRVPF
jgi:hypothetical protein